ncbi:MAG: hypothetical protein LBS89_03450 [Zoogloeaceae bacterium]|nr:hypothetical protein [Zoogloeaceae bacterium]
MVIFNSGVALYAANVAASIADGISLARKVIESGAAKAKLAEFVQYNQRFKS